MLKYCYLKLVYLLFICAQKNVEVVDLTNDTEKPDDKKKKKNTFEVSVCSYNILFYILILYLFLA